MSERGKELYRNTLSYFGFLIVAFNALLILATILWGFGIKQPAPYLGIFTYMVFPAFLSVGVVLVLYGMRRESLRRRKAQTTEALPYPRLDLNEPAQRKWFGIVLVGGSLLAILMAFVGFNAFVFTESVTFCGRICHTVMQPEYTAYLNSPHARVRCVDCHVGSGAQWYVKSKISGAYQVWAVLTHSYERPIPTPVKNLRPARETCEECHWPRKFFGAQLLQIPHFRYDEANTPEQISLVVKTGGGSPKLGLSAGIHWHMIINNTVTFAPEDVQYQTIPWVQVKDHNGKVTVYEDKTRPPTPEHLAAMPRHVMDCMDCHNRPSHIFPAPDSAVDNALAGRVIPRDLPWIKKLLVDTLVKDYKTRPEAREGIAKAVNAFYAEKYPEVMKTRKADVDEAVQAACDIYDHSVFPDMNVNWKTYAMNIGHRDWPGCFRCHDGNHVSKDGKVLSRECTTCHTLPQRGPLGPLGAAVPTSNETWHPMPLQGKHAEILCTRCHSAGYRPPLACAGCHKLDAKAPMMDDCLTCHSAPGVKLPIADCASCHGKPPGLHQKGGHPDASCTDCHKPHVWKITSRDTCLACHDDKKDHNAPTFCGDCHDFKGKA